MPQRDFIPLEFNAVIDPRALGTSALYSLSSQFDEYLAIDHAQTLFPSDYLDAPAQEKRERHQFTWPSIMFSPPYILHCTWEARKQLFTERRMTRSGYCTSSSGLLIPCQSERRARTHAFNSTACYCYHMINARGEK